MNKMLIVVIFLLLTKLNAQELFDSKYYQFYIPNNTNIDVFSSTNEEEAYVDVFKFTNTDGKPKYLLYLMSNKLDEEVIKINVDNYRDFLYDIGDLEVTNVKIVDDKLQIDFLYTANRKVACTIFLSNNNNILNRFLFIFPNLNVYTEFNDEIQALIKSLVYKKRYWLKID